MANLTNINDCNVTDPSKPPVNKFAFDGITTHSNVKNNTYVPPKQCRGTLDYSTSPCAETESNYHAALMNEALQAGAGPVNIFPLLGVHNQGSTLDTTDGGFPLSSGSAAGYNIADGFNVNLAAWRSVQTGAAVLTTPAFIGYNFGVKQAWTLTTPQDRYFPGTDGLIRKQISTIKIKQENLFARAIQLRIEASDDGVTWTRVSVINVPNTDLLATIGFQSAAAYNQWRLIPTFFNGVTADVSWEVVELHLLESTQLSIDNIEDFILLENRNRAYCHSSLMLKCTYDLLDVQTELAKFGISLPQTYIFTCGFAEMIRIIGRPVVVGDIIELPGETQFDSNLRPVRKWLEVTDTGWSTEGYTQNWKPNLFRFYAQPIMPSVEHKDVLGLPGQVNSQQTDADTLLTGFLQNDQAYNATDAVKQASAELVPQAGSDPQNIRSGKPLIKPKGYYDGNDLYAADALPPDGKSFTYGDALPASPVNEQYHRQTYTNVNSAIRPPDRLLKWSADSNRWHVIEINTRAKPQSHKKTIAKILDSTSKVAPDSKL